MNIARINDLLKKREGIHLEFKECKEEIPANIFETICAFLNRDGGENGG